MKSTATRAPGWMRALIDAGTAAKCGSAWLTYCVLRRHANPHCEMTLSVDLEQVASETGYSVSGVRKHIACLESVGLIERWRAAKKGGGRRLLVKIQQEANDPVVALAKGEPTTSGCATSQRPHRGATFNHP